MRNEKIHKKSNSHGLDPNVKNENIDFRNVTSFIGTDVADPTSPLSEKAPRSSKHVVTVTWSWSPMHSRTSEYRLATDKNRETWNLYEVSFDDDAGKKVSSRVATGDPYAGVPAQRAAYFLLKAAWLAEINLWEFDPSGFEIDQEGLLTEGDLFELEEELQWLARSNWLKNQSVESLKTLKPQLPKEPDDQIVETLDEISDCADDLNLPHDFLDLCQHYQLEQPHLLSMLFLLTQEATEQRGKKALIKQENINKFRNIIDMLVSDLDDHQGRGGGMTIPSKKERTRTFLEKYVGERGELPSGVHVTHSFFKTTIDFDELRGKYDV